MADLIIFGLAYLAYLLLALCVVLHAGRRGSRALTTPLGVIVTTHVVLVWALRFGWSLSYTLDKRVPGFVIFHAALTLIVAAVFVPQRWSGRLLTAAFPVVTVGATGAAFKYDYIAVYRWPLIVACLLTIALWGFARRRPR